MNRSVIWLSSTNVSPLRYPGGKAKLTKFIIELIEFNGLKGCTYIEPFAGGAGAALSLLMTEVVNEIVINDYDPCIYAFWYSVLNQTEEFCDLITSTPITIQEWYSQKEKYNTSNNILELGFATFFLNRSNRSGIIKGGPIGGYDQSGNYKIDCRFSKDELTKRIKAIASYRNKITLCNMDAELFIKDYLPNAPTNSFIYLDPPYYKNGPGLYTNFYKDKDHENLAKAIKEYIRQPWILTYDNVEEIAQLYSEYHKMVYLLNYSVNNKYKGQEILVYSDDIIPIVSTNLRQCI